MRFFFVRIEVNRIGQGLPLPNSTILLKENMETNKKSVARPGLATLLFAERLREQRRKAPPCFV